VFAEIDAGTGKGVHVTVDLKITVRPRSASQPDAPGDGPYIFGLFGMPIPVSRATPTGSASSCGVLIVGRTGFFGVDAMAHPLDLRILRYAEFKHREDAS
jgi:hypothetical protein